MGSAGRLGCSSAVDRGARMAGGRSLMLSTSSLLAGEGARDTGILACCRGSNLNRPRPRTHTTIILLAKEYRRSSSSGDGVRRRDESILLFSIGEKSRLCCHDVMHASRRPGEQHAVVEDAHDTHTAYGGVTRFVGAGRRRCYIMGYVMEPGA